MHTKRPLLITLAVVSATLMLLLGILGDLASTYVADSLKPYAAWIFAALGIVFVASLVVLIWQLRAEHQSGVAQPTDGGPSIEQRARGRGLIKQSPIKTSGQPNASIQQTAEDDGRIEDSGITIE